MFPGLILFPKSLHFISVSLLRQAKCYLSHQALTLRLTIKLCFLRFWYKTWATYGSRARSGPLEPPPGPRFPLIKPLENVQENQQISDETLGH